MIYTPDKIRNIAVVGHQGSGKTTLVEALAYITGLIKEKGRIEEKDTISDYRNEEKKRQMSLSSSIIPLAYKDYKINLIDLPGNDDFIYEQIGITRLIKGAVLVIDASKGVQVGTRKAFKRLKKRGVPIFIYLNKRDKDDVDFDSLYEKIKEKLDEHKCVPFSYPIGHREKFDGFVNVPEKKARKFNGTDCVDDVIYDDKKAIIFSLYNRLCESVAYSSEDRLDKFCSGEPLTDKEIKSGLRKGVLNGDLYPILVGSATKNIGLNTRLDRFIDYLPSPMDLKPYIAKDEQGNEVSVKTDNEEPASLVVFKEAYNPYQGRISIFKVNSGIVHLGDTLYCPNNKKTYKRTSLFTICGEKLTPATEITAGDIGAATKLEERKVAYTLSSPERVVEFAPAKYPTATFFRALVPETKKDSDKLFPEINKFQIQMPTLKLDNNTHTGQILLGSLSSSHLDYVLNQIKENGIKFHTEAVKIEYKETITQKAEAEGRYIKQSGGSGYYGVVNRTFEPAKETSFASTVFGGHIDKGYFPPVEEGFHEALKKGLLTGSEVINVKATLTDGKQHTVDSNEMAFKNAAMLAFKNAYRDCAPILLEPYYKIVVNVSPDYLNSVYSDLSRKRGQIRATEEGDDGTLNVIAIVPQAEILEYANELKSLTKSTGFFNLTFEDYKPVPKELAEKIIQSRKK